MMGIIIVTPLILLLDQQSSRAMANVEEARGRRFCARTRAGQIRRDRNRFSRWAGAVSAATLVHDLSVHRLVSAQVRPARVAATIAVLCAIAIAHTVIGSGTLAPGSVNSALLLLLAYVSIAAVTGRV
jgi:hypothetical protein